MSKSLRGVVLFFLLCVPDGNVGGGKSHTHHLGSTRCTDCHPQYSLWFVFFAVSSKCQNKNTFERLEIFGFREGWISCVFFFKGPLWPFLFPRPNSSVSPRRAFEHFSPMDDYLTHKCSSHFKGSFPLKQWWNKTELSWTFWFVYRDLVFLALLSE